MNGNVLYTLGATLCLVLFSGASEVRGGLIHHWAFDEGSGDTASDSAGANDGVINGATWGSDGVRASYLSFNGTNNNVNPSLSLPLMTTTNDFSWAVWANSQEEFIPTAGGQRNSIIIGNRRDGTDTDYSPREFIKMSPQKFEWRPEDTPNNADYDDLPYQEWVHLAVVKDGDNLQAYFNGVPAGSTTVVNNFTNAMVFFIGGEPRPVAPPRADEHFNGFIDDVRLYDMALSAAEVRELAGVVPEPTGVGLLLAIGAGLIAAPRRYREE